MPELPEVETTRRGIQPHVLGRTIVRTIIRQAQLRWPILPELPTQIAGQHIHSITRRAKYLLINTSNGTLIIHLGMSGVLLIATDDTPVAKHDHVDFVLDNQTRLRYRDPRRFGSIHWSLQPHAHVLLTHLGPEPLSEAFSGAHLHLLAQHKTCAVKTFIMDNKIVVGVGNIYANEALFQAGIHPNRAAGRVSRQRYDNLAEHIKTTLQQAIEAGGSTLKDFYHSDGKPGYFQFQHLVYNKTGQPCPNCQTPIKQRKIGQRSAFYCSQCQH